MEFAGVDALQDALEAEGYIADRGLAVSVYLALTLRRPLLLEGEPGVGKTEVARTLQEGALDPDRKAEELYGPEFLVERPLLAAVRAGGGAVLLVDELDRADEEFEAFLLEVLADSAVTIPEIGTITAPSPPAVILTSNRTRELHDALKRRCLYHWIDYPDREREVRIIRLRAPEASEALAESVAELVGRLRSLDLAALGMGAVDARSADETLGWAVKGHDDLAIARRALPELLGG
jgi:MoxR-like ATPase